MLEDSVIDSIYSKFPNKNSQNLGGTTTFQFNSNIKWPNFEFSSKLNDNGNEKKPKDDNFNGSQCSMLQPLPPMTNQDSFATEFEFPAYNGEICEICGQNFESLDRKRSHMFEHSSNKSENK